MTDAAPPHEQPHRRESRLSRREDGRYAYETKRGVTLVLSSAQLVKRPIALIVPKGLHLTNFHGVFAPAAPARSTVVPKAARPTVTVAPKEKKQNKRPRIDWATLLHRTFGCDVWRCACGGQRQVVALVTNRRTAEEMLRNMGMLDVAPPLPQAPGPPQLKLLQ